MATGVTRLAGMFGDRPGRNENVSNAVLGALIPRLTLAWSDQVW